MSYNITEHGFRHGLLEQELPRGIYGNRRYRVTEIDIFTKNYNHIQWYWFEVPFKDYYKETRRMRWFWEHIPKNLRRAPFSIKNQRSYNPKTGRWFHRKFEEDVNIENDLKMNLPTLNLPDLNSFFDAIGFDYKTKKWIS